MNYYRVLYSVEYSKKNGQFGIVDCATDINPHAVSDTEQFPVELIDNLRFVWEGNDKNALADIQMSFFPWRFISVKTCEILRNHLNDDDVYFHKVAVIKGGLSFDYYLMHFNKTYDILIKDKNYKTYGLLNPQIKTNQISGLDLFMYSEFDPSSFMISERVKKAFDQAGITGGTYQLINK